MRHQFRRGGKSHRTSEHVLLSFGLVFVLIAAVAAVGSLLHHAITSVNVWITNLTPP